MNLLHLYRNERFIVFLEKVKKVFYKVLPQYAILPFIIIIGMNVVTYYGSQLITNHLYHYDVTFLMPNDFPLVPSFIYIYILAYVQWIVGYIIIARENKKVCYEILSAEFIAKFLCLICFFLFPTKMSRPEVFGTGFSIFLTHTVYRLDPAINLFPSIHCLESWMCFRGSQTLKKVKSGYLLGQFIFSFFVILSTILVHQHVWIDVIGGIFVVEVGLYLARKFQTGQIFENLLMRISRN